MHSQQMQPEVSNHLKILNVDVIQCNGLLNNLHTTIKVIRCYDNKFLSHAKAFGEVVTSNLSSGIRKLDGNHGQLHTFRMHQYNEN